MKIVYLHQYFNTPDVAGSIRSYEMARRWVAEGHEVHMVTSDRRNGNSPPRRYTTDVEGIRVHWHKVPYSNEMGFTQRKLAFAKFAIASARTARRLRGDVVFATSTPLTIILPAVWATLFRRTPIVFEVRDLWPQIPIEMGALDNPLIRRAARWLEKFAYRRAHTVVALSDGMADGVRKVAPEGKPIIVAPNSCDVEIFDIPPTEGESFREENPWIGDRNLVVYVGTFGKINGVDYLVRLAAELKRREAPVVIAAYGSGAELEAVRELARELGVLDCAFFAPGPLPKAQVPRVLSASELCTSVLKSNDAFATNSANKFFDALAAGRPIAINYGGWQADVIREERIGLVLDPHDLRAAADAVEDFLTIAPDERAGLARRAGETGRRRYARDTISGQVLSALESAGAR
ncbi:glycosyltransferase family 4 protein [Cellulomonas bogoriensis]|uniref:glycosyltransferase family 4 protein n=1 Tax=Cellulomonas bogoriensis TaxID=301388 RepID=UPI0005511BF0|nr:glycosyltransferase family 4 protein [Cellulomonas bogoriensis]